MGSFRKKVADSVRSKWGGVLLYSSMVLTPIAGGLSVIDNAYDDFNDVTTVQSDQAVEEYKSRDTKLDRISGKVSALYEAAKNAETAQATESFKDRQYELSDDLSAQKIKYANDILADDRLTEVGYDDVRDFTSWARNSTLPDAANSWDECRVAFETATTHKACMNDRRVSVGEDMFLTMGAILGLIGTFGFTGFSVGNKANKKLANLIEKGSKNKAPTN